MKLPEKIERELIEEEVCDENNIGGNYGRCVKTGSREDGQGKKVIAIRERGEWRGSLRDTEGCRF